MSASPGRHGYCQSSRRKSHKTDQADRNGGCLVGEGRCWTCPTVRWTQRRAACRKNWSRSSHSRTVSWLLNTRLHNSPLLGVDFPVDCETGRSLSSLCQSLSPSSLPDLPDLLGHPGGGRAVSHASGDGRGVAVKSSTKPIIVDPSQNIVDWRPQPRPSRR